MAGNGTVRAVFFKVAGYEPDNGEQLPRAVVNDVDRGVVVVEYTHKAVDSNGNLGPAIDSLRVACPSLRPHHVVARGRSFLEAVDKTGKVIAHPDDLERFDPPAEVRAELKIA